ncbi:hypothetical protein [Parafilimonas sp.]|uniref:hypothetical protein n=1 Tax=Parafilimonas sp. TaxID=1969739 RepID=UPI0039E6F0F8
MALPAENILQTLFHAPATGIGIDQLKQLVADAPYFGAAHFLLAKNLYQSKQEGYEQALQKAVLHFPDELLLHYNLNIAEDLDGKTVQPEVEEEVSPVAAGFLPAQPSAGLTRPGIEEEFEEEEARPAGETGESLPTDTNRPERINEETRFDAPAENQADLPGGEDFTEEAGEAVSEVAEDAIIHNKLSSLLQEQAAAFEKPADEPVAELVIETIPQHRIDYFASQGIKLEEVKANDKLGTQLRRFTDWLKQMKSINPNPAELRSDETGERQVQSIARHSNEAGDVVTETMAEVLIKQGKPEQAVKIYEKLSFINPSKSVYFAAKIEELKVR